MSAQELASILAAFAAAPKLPADMPIPEMRAIMEMVRERNPIAADIRFERCEMAGVPCVSHSGDKAGDRLLLYFHGGGYIMGSAWSFRGVMGEIARSAGARALSVDYRLAPEHRFPAALDDGLAVYRQLLAEGTDPAKIAIVGDSAGGGLAVAVLVAARDAGLPLPAACLLVSPWTDLAGTGDSMTGKIAADPVMSPDLVHKMAGAYLGDAPAQNPLASPWLADLAGLPPVMIQVGTAELLLDDSTRLATRAAAADVAVTLQVWPGMFHGWQSRYFQLSEGCDAIEVGGAFLKNAMDVR